MVRRAAAEGGRARGCQGGVEAAAAGRAERCVARAARARDVSVYVIVRHALPTHEVGGLARALARRARRDPPARDSAFGGGGLDPPARDFALLAGRARPPSAGFCAVGGVCFFVLARVPPPAFDVRKARRSWARRRRLSRRRQGSRTSVGSPSPCRRALTWSGLPGKKCVVFSNSRGDCRRRLFHLGV